MTVIFWKSRFEKAYWTSSCKETLNQISICDHAYFSKKWVIKTSWIRSFKIKSYNCSICDLNFSRVDILERHVNHFHGEFHKTCYNCNYNFSEVVNLKEHTEPVHVKKKWTRSLFMTMLFHKTVIFENILSLFIQKISHIIAQFVIKFF